MRRHVHILASALLLCALAAPPAPARAESWVLVGSGTAAGTGAFGTVSALVAQVAGATPATCQTNQRRVTVGSLRYNVWRSQDTTKIAYEWFGPGAAEASTACARGVTVTVTVSDYAPRGNPPVVHAPSAAATSTAPQNGWYRAYAESHTMVLYYDLYPLTFYERGDSLVEIKVTGSYPDLNGKTQPLPCYVTYTPVTPTVYGPILGDPTAAQPCG